MYALMLLIGAIVSGIALAPGLQDWLKGVPFCKNSTSFTEHFVPSLDCSIAVGYLTVYRICFAFACFFALMGVIMIGAKSSRDARAGIQNGFWGLKYLIVIAIAIGAFFIPNGSFGTFWMWIGLIGGIVFILVQLVLLVDFAHSWAETWVGEYINKKRENSYYPQLNKNIDKFFLHTGNYEENESRGWYCALLSATFIQYVISIVGIVFLYIHYGCALNNFFITFNMILCLIVSVMSVLPQVQDHISRSGLLQSSVVTLYVVYLTWSALANNPDEKCHAGATPVNPNDTTKVRKLPNGIERSRR